jgi:hypothetical protein
MANFFKMVPNSKHKKLLKVFLSRNPNCSSQSYYVGLFLFGTFISFIQFLFSFFGGYILYHWLSLSPEKVQIWIKRGRKIVLILLVFLIGSWWLDKIFSDKSEFFPPIIWILLLFPPLFGFFLGISLWNLEIFQKNSRLRFIFLPLIIWLGIFLCGWLSPVPFSWLWLVSKERILDEILDIIKTLGWVWILGIISLLMLNLISWEIYQKLRSSFLKFIVFLFIAFLLFVIIFVGTFLTYVLTYTIVGEQIKLLIKSKI